MIAIIIPNRKGREIFAPIWQAHLAKQTMQVIYNNLCQDVANPEKDLHTRLVEGLHWAFKENSFDAVLIFENDDWYSEDYVETMIAGWWASGTPDLFGLSYTAYYHLLHKRYTEMSHPNRASLFCTLIARSAYNKGIAEDIYSVPNNFIDLHIWGNPAYSKATIEGKGLALGMKHGIGYTGGGGHKGAMLNSFDNSGQWLRRYIGQDVELYKAINQSLNA